MLPKRSLTDEVFQWLHQRILAGQVAPGAWLRQEELAAQLGVSQTPVREALDRLTAVGLAERVPFRGVRVPEPSTQEIADAYGVRLLLECASAHAAALNCTPAQAQELFDLLEQTRSLVRLEEMSAQRQLNRSFHRAIAHLTHSPLLENLYEVALNKFPDWRLYEHLFLHPERLSDSLAEEYHQHLALARAIADNDPNQAVQQALAHLTALGQDLITYLEVPATEILARQQSYLAFFHLNFKEQTP